MRRGCLCSFAVLVVACSAPPPRYAEIDLDAADAAFFAQANRRNEAAEFDGLRYDRDGRAIPPPATGASDAAANRGRSSQGRPGEQMSVPADQFEARTLGASGSPAPRPARNGRRDIELHDARLDNALRLIADAGEFNLVVKGEMSGRVSLSLRNVDPYDALRVLARSHGARVEMHHGIVVVMPDRD